METLEEMKKRHREEYKALQANCPHTEVKVFDENTGFRQRKITIICTACGTPIVGWFRDTDSARVEFAKGFVRTEEDKDND